MKGYTIEERKKIFREANKEEFSENSAKYRELCREKLKDISCKNPVQFGFNACLTMIREATDIDWEKVKWNTPHASMTLWFHEAVFPPEEIKK